MGLNVIGLVTLGVLALATIFSIVGIAVRARLCDLS